MALTRARYHGYRPCRHKPAAMWSAFNVCVIIDIAGTGVQIPMLNLRIAMHETAVSLPHYW
jgi:hypothetical protein